MLLTQLYELLACTYSSIHWSHFLSTSNKPPSKKHLTVINAWLLLNFAYACVYIASSKKRFLIKKYEYVYWICHDTYFVLFYINYVYNCLPICRSLCMFLSFFLSFFLGCQIIISFFSSETHIIQCYYTWLSLSLRFMPWSGWIYAKGVNIL